MGFATVDAMSEDRFALDAAAQVLSGLGGRLFAEVRGRRGLAYTVAAWHTLRKDAGMFVTYTATAPEKEDEARGAILTELDRLRQEPVSAEELERAKAFIAGAKRIGLQTSRAQARDLSRAALYGRPQEASKVYVERIRALTAEDLQRVAQTYFDPERYALGALRGGM
jgi:zinc protease